MVNNQAFPSHGTMGEAVQIGMTMRQYYKVRAFQLIEPDDPHSGMFIGPGNPDIDAIAKFCGQVADAMLKEDEKHETGGTA